jgi:hypothetical protein
MGFFFNFGDRRNRGRYRRSTFGIGPRAPRGRGYYSWGGQPRGYYPMRRRGGGNVRVVGCCLPIPLGFMALGVLLRTALARGDR